MRVVRVYYRLPPAPGGMELHIERLSRAQRELGVEVVNVYSIGAAEGPALSVCRSLPLDRIRPQSLRNLIFYTGIARNADKLGRRPRTVLHVHGAWSDFMLSKMLARVINADAVFASIHGAVRPSSHRLYRTALSHCSVVFATGRSDQMLLARILDREVVHLPSGVAEEFVSPVAADGECAVQYDAVAVGNLVPKKRMDLFLECARLRPNLKFAIVGDGPVRASLESVVAARGLGNVAVLGRRVPKEVASILRASRVFVSTSEEEGTPTAALEAMAAGLPVVLTPSSDYSWLVEPSANGFVTSGWSAEEIVGWLDVLLSDEPRRTAMGRRNRASISQHTWPRIAARLNTLMATVLEGRRAR